MGLRVVGAGVPRTGTASLKVTLEQLLGGRCYHMFEFSNHKECHRPRWHRVFAGELEQLDAILADWTCAVDWPASILWREVAERNPNALVVLSRRSDSATWWQSADATVWESMRRAIADDHPDRIHFNTVMRRAAGLGDDWDDETAARAWYEAHNAAVLEAIPPERLLVWEPSDGAAPIAERLGLPVPDVETVHVNARATFRERAGFD